MRAEGVVERRLGSATFKAPPDVEARHVLAIDGGEQATKTAIRVFHPVTRSV